MIRFQIPRPTKGIRNGSRKASGRSEIRRQKPAIEQLEQLTLLAGGLLDPTFSGDGLVVTRIGSQEAYITDTALQGDKIIAVGPIATAGTFARNSVFIARYNNDGSLDATFGAAANPGYIVADLGTTYLPSPLNPAGVIVQSTGQIVVGGTRRTAFNAADIVVVRYDANGQGALVTTAVDVQNRDDTFAAIEKLPTSDSFVVGGTTRLTTGAPNDDFALIRFVPAATLDNAFGAAGIFRDDLGANESLADVAILPDGRIVAGGNQGTTTGVFARYTANGARDGTYGGGAGFGFPRSFTAVDFSGRNITSINALDVQADGRVVAAGASRATASSTFDFLLLRLGIDGGLDTTFGAFGGGINYRDFGSQDDFANDVAVQSNGQILVGGTSGTNFNLARFNATGAIDTTFGNGGSIPPTVFGTGRSLLIQPDAKVVLAGSDTSNTLQLARYNLVDPATSGDFFFTNATYNATEGGTVAVQVGRFGGTTRPASITVVSQGGSATPGVDYTPASMNLNFAPGEVFKDLILNVPNDTPPLSEGTETAFLALTNPSPGAALGFRPNATLVIRDSPGILNFSTAQVVAVSTIDSSVTVTVSRNGGIGGAVSVNYAVTSLGGDTATPFVDFNPVSGTLAFADGQATATFTVPILNNSAATDIRTATITLSNPTGGVLIGSPTARLVITSIPGVIEFARNPSNQLGFFTGVETNVTGQLVPVPVTVIRSGTIDLPMSVFYTTADGTATAGINYVATSGRLDFVASETSKTFQVLIRSDGAATGNLGLRVILTGTSGGALIGGRAQGTLAIIDAPGLLQIESPITPVLESARAATVTVRRTVGIGSTVTVDYRTVDGSARAGVDYAGAAGTLTFAAGEQARTITIPFVNDGRITGVNRTFRVELSQPGNGAELGAVSATTVSILDARQPNAIGDYNGDGRSDLSVFRPIGSVWYSSDAAPVAFGGPNDVLVPGHYDDPTRTQRAVYRPSTGQWFLLDLNGTAVRVVSHGQPNVDIPVPADFDGDGRTDIAVYRPTTAQWFIRYSTLDASVQSFGFAGVDRPVIGDFDGDGITDLAVFRPTTAQWFVLQSSGGQTMTTYGAANLDQPIPADFDGDGRTELAVYRPTTSEWFVSTRPGAVQFGAPGLDVPVPLDYDGDGRVDLAVFRQGSAQWFLSYARGGGQSFSFGAPGIDVATEVPLSYRRGLSFAGATTATTSSRGTPIPLTTSATDSVLQLFSDSLVKNRKKGAKTFGLV